MNIETQVKQRIHQEIGRLRRPQTDVRALDRDLAAFEKFLKDSVNRLLAYYDRTVGLGRDIAADQVVPLRQMRELVQAALARRLEIRALVLGLIAQLRAWEGQLGKRRAQFQRGQLAVLRGSGNTLTPEQKHTLNTNLAALISQLRKIDGALATKPINPALLQRHVQSVGRMLDAVQRSLFNLTQLLQSWRGGASGNVVGSAIDNLTGFQNAVLDWRDINRVTERYEHYAKHLRPRIALLRKALNAVARAFGRGVE